MTYGDWVDVVQPKVNGTWNLHHALRDSQLDFFWLASTLLSAIEPPGQGNYVATGVFLEAFCQYRHSLGLPASVLNVGPIRGVGRVAESTRANRHAQSLGLCSWNERDLLDFLELGLVDCSPTCSFPSQSEDGGDGRGNDNTGSGSGSTVTATNPWINKAHVFMGLRSELALTDPNNRACWLRNRRMGVYHNVRPEDEARRAGERQTDEAAEPDALQDFITSAKRNADKGGVNKLSSGESIDFVALELGKKIHELMLRPDEEVDIGLALIQLGVDSLVAVELGRWIKQTFGVTTSVLETVGTGTLRGLSRSVTTKLADKIREDNEGQGGKKGRV